MDEFSEFRTIVVTVILGLIFGAVMIIDIALHGDTPELKPPTEKRCDWLPSNLESSTPISSWVPGRPYQFDQFYVKGVPNPSSLQVWSNLRYSGETSGPTDYTVTLAGIWSEKTIEPAAIYAARLEFLKRLVGCKVMVSTSTDTYFTGTTLGGISRRISVPAEVLIDRTQSLNELLLRTGSAMLNPKEELFEEEIRRYELAQSEASAARRGLWSSEKTSHLYNAALVNLGGLVGRTPPKPAPQGLSRFLIVQAVLLFFGAILTYSSWSDRETRTAALFLLSLPIFFAAPYVMVRLAPTLGLSGITQEPYPLSSRRDFPSGSDLLWFPYYATFAVMLIVWIRALWVLVGKGPLHEWGSIWQYSRVQLTIVGFFTGLVGVVGLFFLFYYFFGQFESLAAALYVSTATALGLAFKFPVASDFASLNINVVEKVSVTLLLLFCGAMIPRAERRLELNANRFRVFVMCFASIAAGAIALASIFTGVFYASGVGSDVGECFWFAFANLFRLSYGGPVLPSMWLQIVQSIEVCVGFFLSLVGFRAIVSVLQPQSGRG